MNSIEEQAADVLPRIVSVSAARASWTLHVMWADRTQDRIDLTGLVHRSRHFRVFLDQPAAFRKVRVADFGGGIEWENGLDYGADTLKVMADEQRPMSGADLAAFESELDLSTAETAALLGLAERTVRAYRKAKRLPQSVAIAMRTIRASNTVLAAHYRPVGHRARGRPRKEAPSGERMT
jgi:DNA-binding transcriptional regulator YiaG